MNGHAAEAGDAVGDDEGARARSLAALSQGRLGAALALERLDGLQTAPRSVVLPAASKRAQITSPSPFTTA